MNITASNRSAILRLASSLPVGDKSRRAILARMMELPKTLRPWKFDRFFHIDSETQASTDGRVEARISWSGVNEHGWSVPPKTVAWTVHMDRVVLKSGQAPTVESAKDFVGFILDRKGYQ